MGAAIRFCFWLTDIKSIFIGVRHLVVILYLDKNASLGLGRFDKVGRFHQKQFCIRCFSYLILLVLRNRQRHDFTHC